MAPPNTPEKVTTVPGIKAPPPLICESKSIVDNWKLFKQKWNNYAIITNLKAQPAEYQVALFLHTLGDDALKIYNGLQIDKSESERTVKDIIDAFDKFAVGETNETYERFIFNQRNQQEGEPFEVYLSILRQLIKSCNYCDACIDSNLRDRIVLGVRDLETQSALLKERKLTLDKAVDICRAAENATQHIQAMGTLQKHSENINKVKVGKSATSARVATKTCKYCGYEHPMLKSKCPAYGKTCSRCKRENHFAKVCQTRDKGNSQINAVHADPHNTPLDESDDEIVDSIASKSTSKDIRCRLLLLPSKTEVIFQVDTGASVNVLPLKYHPANIPLEPANKSLYAWNGEKITTLGSCKHTVYNTLNGQRYSIEFLIIKEDLTPILGLKDSQTMRFVTINEENFERVLKIDLGEYEEVFEESIGTFPGTHSLKVNPNVKPVVMPDRRIPLSVRPQLKDEIDDLVSRGIIAPVDEPTPWVSQVVVTMKKSGKLRVCIDPRELNKALLREHYTLPILEDVLHGLRKSKVFTKADLSHGYWHVALDEHSSMLTTFQTCFGRFRWLRLPFGICVASEIFQRKLLEALDGLEGVVCVADDIIIHGETLEDHDCNLKSFLHRCREKGIHLNKAKLELRTDVLTFLGHRITVNGLEVDPDKVKAVSEMTAPKDLKHLRTFIGMVNYMAKFVPNLSATLKPLLNLTKADVPWNWSSAEQQAFDTVKALLSKAPVLAFYDPSKPLTVENDASEYGLGAVLKQNEKPIAYASRVLSETERAYAQIEKEMLAVIFGLQKFHHYTFGRKVTVVTDHKPLVSIVKKPLHCAPKRLQSMLLKSQSYDFDLIYAPGTTIPVADALSRAPIHGFEPIGAEHETVHNLFLSQMKPKYIQKVKEASRNDVELTHLRKAITEGWPQDKNELIPQLRLYFPYRDELTVQDSLILRGQRLIIPNSLRGDMKAKCHAGHLGINSTLRRARDILFWPGLSTDIREYVETCGVCASMPAKQPPEPVISRDVPERPWQRVGADILSYAGHDYLITTDHLSAFFEVDHLPNISAETVIKKLKKNFARHGIPEELTTDSGSQFTAAAFKNFSEEWDFNHTMSSPGNHRANGAAEAAVKTAKRIFKRSKIANEDPYLGLLNLRNTPSETSNQSPVQQLFGRRTRTLIPTTSCQLIPQTLGSTKQLKEDKTACKIVNLNQHRKDLPQLMIGDTVRLQPIDNSNTWKEATITKQTDSKTYEVQDERGRKYRRNRGYLRKTRKSQHSIPHCPPRTSTMNLAATDTTEETANNQTEKTTTNADCTSAETILSNNPPPEPRPTTEAHTITRSGRRVIRPERYECDKA